MTLVGIWLLYIRQWFLGIRGYIVIARHGPGELTNMYRLQVSVGQMPKE